MKKGRREIPPMRLHPETPYMREYPDPYFDFLDNGEVPYPIPRADKEQDRECQGDDLYWREPEGFWADDMWPWPEGKEREGKQRVSTPPEQGTV
ncbi:MAG: hypothetical protein IMW97_08535 [Firmicutes bacterium]|nr:hypothetical protein [Candidatus Fermentithermobacillaceae bacterium]